MLWFVDVVADMNNCYENGNYFMHRYERGENDFLCIN